MDDGNPLSPSSSPTGDSSTPRPAAARPEPIAPAGVTPLSPATPSSVPPAAPAAPFDSGSWARTTRGLAVWLVMLAAFGIGGLLLDQRELAALAAAAGLFVAAQAADLDSQWRMLHYGLAWVPPVLGAAGFVSLGVMMLSQQMAGDASRALAAFCFASALASAITLWRPAAN